MYKSLELMGSTTYLSTGAGFLNHQQYYNHFLLCFIWVTIAIFVAIILSNLRTPINRAKIYGLSIINFHYQYYIMICYHKNLVSLLFPYHHYSQYIPIPKNHVSISPEFLLPASKLSTTRHLTSYGHPSRPIKSAMVFLRGATSAHIESGSDGVNLSWQSKGHTPPQEKRSY